MKRRQFIQSIALGVGTTSASSLLLGCSQKTVPEASNELNIPQMIDSRESNHDIQVSIQHGEHEFYQGIKSKTKGFNGNYLGPTIRLYNGENTRLRFTNNIGEDTTVHGHGLHVTGMLDGGPSNVIKSGETWDVTLPIRQNASTNWYHPHLMGKTAEHVHAGLAGFYWVEDKNSQSLPLPKTYGVDDIPLVVQDRTFIDKKMKNYSVTMEQIMSGLLEDTPVVNGTVDAYVEVPIGWVRLRLLNGSNARFYEFYLKGKQTFYKIATEGGFLEAPVPIVKMLMAPGERNEIMINLSDGHTQDLMAVFRAPSADDEPLIFKEKKRILELRPNTKLNVKQQSKGTLPKNLNVVTPFQSAWKREQASVTRNFMLNMEMSENLTQASNHASHAMHHMLGINGKTMSRDRIDETVKKGDIEIWRIQVDEMLHPFHMHGTSFMILQHNGKPTKLQDRGWKDVVVIDEGVTEVIMKFDHEATKEHPYMYHCHILEHEDAGMMGQFTVINL